MATSSITFSGMSTFASDFQTVINRAVQIASLPMIQLNDTKNDLANQVSEYSILDSDLSTLRAAITQLQSAITASGSSSAASSDTSILTTSLTSAAMAGSYDVEVTQLGSYSRYMSQGSLEGTIPSGDYTFTLNDGSGARDYHVTISGTDMSDLVSAINNSGAPVQASMVNMGTTASPSYRLSLQSTKMAAVTMSLTQGSDPTDLLQQSGNLGRAMKYTINGDSTGISSDSATVTLSPGLNVTLLKEGSAKITVTRSTSSVASALNSIAMAYNTVMTELARNHGQSGGALTGQSQVTTLENDLRQLMNFKSSDGAGSLSNLGLSFDKDGNVSFDTSTLSRFSFDQIASYLGSSTSGFLDNANALLDEMDGTSSGIVTDTVETLKDQISKVNDQIDDQQQRVDLLQSSLLEQMSKADSAIYQMEQQADYYKNLFQMMQQNSKNITG